LDQFFAYWAVVSFGQLFLITKSIPNVFANFFHGKSYSLILTKALGWATFWARFSQTHLVTLPGSSPNFRASFFYHKNYVVILTNIG
jgi:hypothetical protein